MLPDYLRDAVWKIRNENLMKKLPLNSERSIGRATQRVRAIGEVFLTFSSSIGHYNMVSAQVATELGQLYHWTLNMRYLYVSRHGNL